MRIGRETDSRVSNMAEIKKRKRKKKKILIRRFRDLRFVGFRDLGFVKINTLERERERERERESNNWFETLSLRIRHESIR